MAQSARSIENALTLDHMKSSSDLLIRLNWPGRSLGDETDGLVCLNADGYVTAANQMARLMLPQILYQQTLHASDLFAMSFSMLFDAARKQSGKSALEVPLWTGLRLHALPIIGRQAVATATTQLDSPAHPPPPLKDIETALIRKAVDDARGNVMQAAKALGISRATVYRRLGSAAKRH